MTALVAEIERVAYRAWTPDESAVVGPWAVRAAHGLSRRLNSAEPVADPSVDELVAGLTECRAWLAERGVPLVVRATPLRPEGLDAALLRRGFAAEGETCVMARPIDGGAVGHRVRIGPTRGESWIETQLRLKGFAGPPRGWIAVLDRVPQPAAFAELLDGEEPIAAGLGVLGERWLAVFDVNVAAEQRRRGYGRALMENLHAWAAARGATRAFLQVQADNQAGLGLYRSLGYRTTYRYHYLREAGNAPV